MLVGHFECNPWPEICDSQRFERGARVSKKIPTTHAWATGEHASRMALHLIAMHYSWACFGYFCKQYSFVLFWEKRKVSLSVREKRLP